MNQTLTDDVINKFGWMYFKLSNIEKILERVCFLADHINLINNQQQYLDDQWAKFSRSHGKFTLGSADKIYKNKLIQQHI